MPTGNTPAPISSTPSSRSTTPSSPRSAISPPSCCRKANQRTLDIGCGWGGLALYLAEFCRTRVTGVTLSKEQWQRAGERAAERNLTGSVDFRMEDYRDLQEKFDRIVSVGMFEHVGLVFYDAFFHKCAELLADDGVMLLHSIGRSEGPNVTNPWIAKYIFPGGYIPALSEVLPSIERSGLLITDIEILRLHYAETLRAWRERFLAHREEAERIYDQRFVRMWEFYLAASEVAFREQAMMVMQIQLDQAPGRGADHARLHCARGSAAAHARTRPTPAAATRRRIIAARQSVAIAPVKHRPASPSRFTASGG